MDNDAVRWYCRDGVRFNELMRELEHRSNYALIRAADRLELILARNVVLPPVILFRGIDWSYAQTLRNHEVGHVLFDPGFMSTSKSLAKAWRFAALPPGGVVLAITSARPINGLDVSTISETDEEEVILAPGTRLKIVGLNPAARMIETEVFYDTEN